MPIPKPDKTKGVPKRAKHGKKDYAVLFARAKARKKARVEKRLTRFDARRDGHEAAVKLRRRTKVRPFIYAVPLA